MNLRDKARGEPCQIRIPGVCNGDPETSVLAHYRLAGLCGAGQKPPDVCASIACSACHDVVDGRVDVGLGFEYRRQLHAEGVIRTLAKWSKEGVL